MLGSHAAASAPPAEARTAAHLRAVPVWAWLGSIVVAAASVRWGLALARAVPSYIPDEFLYTSLARSIGQHGTSEVHGNHAAFPALLQPLLTAPLWLAPSVGTGLALVKALNAVAMAGACVPLYLIARKLRLERPAALAAALLGALSPNLDFVGLVLSNPISYPLVLGAVLVAISVLERATSRGQLAFLGLSGLATFASIQFVVLPAVLVGAAVVVERGNLRRVARELRLTLGLLLVGSFVLLLRPGMLGFYRHAPHLGAALTPASWLHWASLGGLLVAVSAGGGFVARAVAGIAHGLFRARERREIAFAALLAGLVLAFLTEAASIELRTHHFEERYLLPLAPLLPIAFLLWAQQRFPLRAVAAAVAAAILVVLPIVPLSTYALRDGASDSPFLEGIAYLERQMSAGAAGLLVALAATVLALLALFTALRPSRAAVGASLAAGAVWLAAVSTASATLGIEATRAARAAGPADPSWVDHSGARHVVLVSTFGARPYQAILTFFWNPRAVDRQALLARGVELDPFGASRLAIGKDGSLRMEGHVLRRPFVLDDAGSAAQLTGVRPLGAADGYTLWQPIATPRLRMLAEGFYAHKEAAQTADVRLWPDAAGTLAGTLHLRFGLLRTMRPVHLTPRAPGLLRTVYLRPGEEQELDLPVRATRATTLHIDAAGATGYDGGPLIAALAAPPQFVPGR